MKLLLAIGFVLAVLVSLLIDYKWKQWLRRQKELSGQNDPQPPAQR